MTKLYSLDCDTEIILLSLQQGSDVGSLSFTLPSVGYIDYLAVSTLLVKVPFRC